nr:serine protease [Ardenticatena sp.]
MLRTCVIWTLFVSVLFLSSCSSISEEERATIATEVAATIYATQTATRPTNTPEAVAPPEPTPPATPSALNSVTIFQRVSPSVAFIETPIATGSGFVFAPGFLATNAHVVWPFETVRVRFPDGVEYTEARIVGWDLVRDLAVITLPDDTHTPLPFAESETLPTGSEVYLIGYPAEVERDPQPTITRGILARQREWEAGGLTYLQTDATITGGQSGGVLVSPHGNIIGLSGFLFGDGQFALAASSTDIQPHLQRLAEGDPTDGLGRFPAFSLDNATREDDATLQTLWSSAVWVMWPETTTSIEVVATSSNDLGMRIIDALASIITDTDNTLTGKEQVVFRPLDPIPHWVEVHQYDPFSANVHIESSQPIAPVFDPDDDTELTPGMTYTGAIDYPDDLDAFLLSLDAGQAVTIRVESVAIDAKVLVDESIPSSEAFLASDDDSGGGLFGLDAEVSFTAPKTGTYVVLVRDAIGYETGGYFIHVSPVR